MEVVMNDNVIIYGKAGWPYTTRARDAYSEHTYHDVKSDPDKMEEMLKLSSGKRRVPVIVEGGKVSVGYNNGSWGV